MELSVFKIVGHPACFLQSDGQRVYDCIKAAMKNDRSIMLSFLNVTTLAPEFLNAAIGQLYSVFSASKIRELLNIRDMQQDDMELLRRVIEMAQQYLKDRGFMEYQQKPVSPH